MKCDLQPLANIASIPKGPLNPSKYPEEEFILYSLPAYDSGHPHRARGVTIKSSKTLVQKGDVLVSKLNPRIPRVWLVEQPSDHRSISSTEFIPFRILDADRYDAQFLAFVMLAPQFIGELALQVRSSTGSHQRVRPADVLKKKIPVPPLEEQRRLVARIKECMERVEEIERLRSEANAEREAAARSFFYETYESLLASYQTVKLSSLGKAMGGGTPSKKRNDFWDGEVPWVSPKDMKFPIIKTSRLKITKTALNGSAAKLIPSGSVLFVVRGMILAHTLPVAINEIPVAINQDMKAIVPNEAVQSEFLSLMIKGAERKLLTQVEIAGHGTRRLQTEHWLNLQIPKLTSDEQHRIVDQMHRFSSALSEIREQQSDPNISHLRDAILSRAFSGEL